MVRYACWHSLEINQAKNISGNHEKIYFNFNHNRNDF